MVTVMLEIIMDKEMVLAMVMITKDQAMETKDKLVVNCTGASIEVESCNTQPCPGDYRLKHKF